MGDARAMGSALEPRWKGSEERWMPRRGSGGWRKTTGADCPLFHHILFNRLALLLDAESASALQMHLYVPPLLCHIFVWIIL